MNIPEVTKDKSTAAACAPNKEKTQDLIQLHERKIKQISEQNGDEILGKKVIKKCINQRTPFQIMNTKNDEHSKKGSPMVSSKKDKAEVYRHENTAEDDWTEVPDTPALMHEIASMLEMDVKRSRITIAKDARLELARFNNEVEDPDSEDEEQEHTHNIRVDHIFKICLFLSSKLFIPLYYIRTDTKINSGQSDVV